MGRLFNHKGAKRLLAIGAVGILGMGVTACGSSSSNSSDSAATGSSLAAAGTTTAPDSEATYPVFEIDAEMPYKFSLPEATAPSGYVQVKLVNNDKQMAHHAQLVKLRDGVTFDKFKTDLTGPMGEGAMMADGTPAGGPNAIGPGQSDTAIVDLAPGATYAVLCLIPGPDGKPHYMSGMLTSFTVDTKPGVTTAPTAASTVKLADYSFTLDGTVDWSKPVKVANDGKEAHELAILGPVEGKTLEDVRSFLTAKPGTVTGPPPYQVYGGVAAIAPGTSEVFQPELKTGKYFLICFVATAEPPHIPHFMKGMMTEIDVP